MSHALEHSTDRHELGARRRALLGLGLSLGALGLPAWAQPLSDRPIRIVVGAPAGGTADIIARLVGNAMSTSMSQPVVVDNKPGVINPNGEAQTERVGGLRPKWWEGSNRKGGGHRPHGARHHPIPFALSLSKRA